MYQTRMMSVEQSVEWEVARETEVPTATLSTTNPLWLEPASIPGRRDGKRVSTVQVVVGVSAIFQSYQLHTQTTPVTWVYANSFKPNFVSSLYYILKMPETSTCIHAPLLPICFRQQMPSSRHVYCQIHVVSYLHDRHTWRHNSIWVWYVQQMTSVYFYLVHTFSN
jgi:hypothetical protein